jgi:chromosome segregation ATPase
MAFSGATKKLQQIVDMAEETYRRLNDLREQVATMQETVLDTNRRVRELERTVEDQRALVEALAHEADVDVDRVLAEAAIEEAEPVDHERAEAAVEEAEDDAVVGDAEGDESAGDSS